MPCHLLDLPAELLLKIIQQLLRDEDAIIDRGSQEQQDEPLRVFHDLTALSFTCSDFRNMIAPYIFRATILGNNEKSGASLNAVANSPHNVLVKELHFIGSPQRNGYYCEEAEFFDIEGVLPASVETLLCDLQKFPNLERLSVKFDYISESPAMNFAVDVETEEDTVEAEGSKEWRALMSKTYSVLAKNKLPHFKHFEVQQLIWKKVSTLTHAPFHDFLRHFEQFTLSIHGEDSGIGWRVNASEQYPALMGLLDEYFFNHLTNVTTLTIKAPNEGPLGLEGMNHAPLRLHADQMPLLKILNLENVFASPELTGFLVGHKSTLEVVTLHCCYACPARLVENGIYWSELFTALVSARPAHLRQFTFIGIETESFSGEKTIRSNEQVRTILREDPARLLFPYACLDDKWGWLAPDEEESVRALLEGKDQASWTRLMALLEENQGGRVKLEGVES